MLGFPIHHFHKSANHASSLIARAGNRSKDPFKNTMTLLEDPKSGKKLYLIGSIHCSTLLAYRTKKLLNEVNPDSVYVQVSNQWWDIAKHVKATTQTEMNHFNSQFQLSIDPRIEDGVRGCLFFWRYHTWLWTLRFFLGLSSDFQPFIPGLEAKFALEYATEHKKPVLMKQ